jgi:hypothetical protein
MFLFIRLCIYFCFCNFLYLFYLYVQSNKCIFLSFNISGLPGPHSAPVKEPSSAVDGVSKPHLFRLNLNTSLLHWVSPRVPHKGIKYAIRCGIQQTPLRGTLPTSGEATSIGPNLSRKEAFVSNLLQYSSKSCALCYSPILTLQIF